MNNLGQRLCRKRNLWRFTILVTQSIGWRELQAHEL